ncbi:alpha/beta hydrolase [Plantactinospora sp. B24E8]|uniref:alpha/beta hydrolase n=1 Tax=Plantactinospora sp. B24E8 TaxID=3153567 RepID=UPI00325DC1BB
MRRTFRAGVGLLAATLILSGANPAVAAPAAPAPERVVGDWRPGPIDWQPCPEVPDDPGVRCATLHLPIDWRRPHGPTFPLAIAKRAATGPEPAVGPLLVNPGGPGGSGVDEAIYLGARFGGEPRYSPELLRRFDLIGFDPRGVARSHPLVCSSELLAQQPFLIPESEAAYTALVNYNRRLYADCRTQTGPLFDHLDSVDVAYDMDAVRAALGARHISYYALSYGSLIGQMYAEHFPDRIRAMAIDSNMDHSLGVRDFLRTGTVAVQELFDGFVAWCGRDERCALHGRDVRAIFDDLLRRAEAGELVNPDTGAPMHWSELGAQVRSSSFEPLWIMLSNWLAALVDQTSPTAAGAVAPRRAVPAADRAGTAPGTDATSVEVTEHPFLIFCQDWSLPVRSFAEYSRHLAELRRVAPQVRISTLSSLTVGSCIGWPARPGNPQHRLRVRTSIPLLVLGVRYDPSTPYQWSVNVAKQLGRHGRLVTYLGWGHGGYNATPCTVSIVDRYLVDRKLPPPGAACVGVLDPTPRSQPSGTPSPQRPGLPAPTLPNPPTWFGRHAG